MSALATAGEASLMMTSCNGNIFRVTGHAWNSPVNSPHKGQWRGALLDLCLNKRLSKHLWGWWFETPSRSLWRHCNAGESGHIDHINPVWWNIQPQQIKARQRPLRIYGKLYIDVLVLESVMFQSLVSFYNGYVLCVLCICTMIIFGGNKHRVSWIWVEFRTMANAMQYCLNGGCTIIMARRATLNAETP